MSEAASNPPGSVARWLKPHRRRLPAYVMLTAVLSLFFVPGWGGHGGRFAQYTHDLAHFPAMATIAAGLLSVIRRGRSALLKAGLVVCSAFGIALLVEIFQPYFGRTAALNDWLLGAAGAFAAACVYLAFKADSQHHRKLFVGLAGVALMACLTPLLLMAADWYAGIRAFPVLDSFERPVELGRWKAEGCTIRQSREHVTMGKYSLQLEVTDPPDDYPSIFFDDGPIDWTGYGRFAVDVYLGGQQSRMLWIRADDMVNPPYNERAQMSVELKPGMNTIWVDLDAFAKLPSGRRLDVRHIETFGLFLDHPKAGDTIYVDRMVLSARSAR